MVFPVSLFGLDPAFYSRRLYAVPVSSSKDGMDRSGSSLLGNDSGHRHGCDQSDLDHSNYYLLENIREEK